jgi:hypothetical protein
LPLLFDLIDYLFEIIIPIRIGNVKGLNENITHSFDVIVSTDSFA